MRFDITHVTDYRYEHPASEAYIEARLTPPSRPAQKILSHAIEFAPDAPVTGYTDYFGNPTVFYSMIRRHERLAVTNRLSVQTAPPVLPGEALELTVGEARQIFSSMATDVFDHLRGTAAAPNGGEATKWGRRLLRSDLPLRKAITELNFRKGTLLEANSIYLAEGQWNPAAYEDAKRRGEAMTHALDNTHVDAVPSEFTAGPAINAWESQSSPDRPHIPGVVDSIPPRTTSGGTSGSTQVPGVPAAEPQQATPVPAPAPEPAPMEMPPQQPRRVPANAIGLPANPQQGAVQGQIRNAVKTEQAPTGRSKEVRNRMSNTGKASL